MQNTETMLTASFFLSFLLTIICYCQPVGASASDTVSNQIDYAIEHAKSGNLTEAIEMLYELGRIHPKNTRALFDLSVLLLRDGQYERALAVLERYPIEQLPDYLLTEAMRSCRQARLFKESLQFAGEYRRRYPDSFESRSFEILVLADAGKHKQSLLQSKKLTKTWPRVFQAWNTRGYANERAGHFLEALRAYQQSLQLAPGEPEAERRLVVTLEKLGATSLAEKLAREKGTLLVIADRNRIYGSNGAKIISQAPFEPTELLLRQTNQKGVELLDSLIQEQRALKDEKSALLDGYTLRLRFDRIIGWRDRKMMHEVKNEYEILLEGSVDIPNYVKQAAADAYLYLELPTEAAALYEFLVASEPNNVNAKVGLFFALIEAERIGEAHELALEWNDQSPAWIRPADSPEAVPNPEKTSFSELVTLSLYFADQLVKAQKRLEQMVEVAPNMSSLRTSLGDIYKSRGWIQKAIEQYELVLALDPANRAARVGLAAISMNRYTYEDAREQVVALQQEFPADKHLYKLKKELDVAQSWDITMESGYEESDGDTFGSESSFLGARLYSPIFYEAWRLFGDYRYQAGEFIEGNESLNRYSLGAVYKKAELEAELEFGRTYATVEDETAIIKTQWRPDDFLRFGLQAELFSKETPLRAVKNGVQADRVAVDGGYRFSESMDWRWQLGYMDFSDGNKKTDVHTGLYNRLYNFHRFVLDGDIALYASHATLEDAAYFNPELHYSLPLSIKPQYMIWRRYDKSFWNRLALEAGPVYQKDYGTDLNWSINYEHAWKLLPGWEIVYGIGYASRVYDGDRESSWFFSFSIY